MKLTRLLSKSFSRTSPETKSSIKASRRDSDKAQAQTPKANLAKPVCNGGTREGQEAIDWELRPGGMLVQRRDPLTDRSPSSGPLIKVKVSHGAYQHDITIPAQATFGDLKWLLAQEIGLQPHEQRLLFKGKEKEDNECLHIAGVKDMEKVILVEDPASKEKKLEEMKRDIKVVKACQLVHQVRMEADTLAGQIAALDGVINSGTKVTDRDFSVLSELLMRLLLKLDSIEAEGEAKVQRKVEVRRVQGFVEHVDSLRVRNSNPLYNNTVVVTTQWETFDAGLGSLTAPPSSAPTTISTKWQLFD